MSDEKLKSEAQYIKDALRGVQLLIHTEDGMPRTRIDLRISVTMLVQAALLSVESILQEEYKH